jgi:hypothetical protein
MAICFVDVATFRKEQEEQAGFLFHFDSVLEEGLGRTEAPLVRVVERLDHRVLERQLLLLRGMSETSQPHPLRLGDQYPRHKIDPIRRLRVDRPHKLDLPHRWSARPLCGYLLQDLVDGRKAARCRDQGIRPRLPADQLRARDTVPDAASRASPVFISSSNSVNGFRARVRKDSP